MARSGDFLRMQFNTLPFYDHPPAGFWLMALSYKLFGISEWSTRFPSAVCGIGTILLVYLTAVRLFGKKSIGFVAALIIGTSVWYVLRVRSGNLDSTFIFFYILTIYCAIRSRMDIRWFVPTMASFALLFLTKTLAGASAIFLVLLINSNHLKHLKDPKVLKHLALGMLLAALIILPWYVVQYITYPNFYHHHFIDIGMRNKSFASYIHANTTVPFYYLHMGIRKWYYLWFSSLVIIGIKRLFLKKEVLFLLLWNILVFYPFLSSDRTEIWHLIPVYVPIALLIAYGSWEGFLLLAKPLKKIRFSPTVLFLGSFILLAMIQYKTFYHEVIPANNYRGDDVAITKASHLFPGRVFLDDDFLPMAVFYADRVIYPIRELNFYNITGDKGTLLKFFNSEEKDFAVITRKWVTGLLNEYNIHYKIVAKNNTFVIVTR